MAKEPVDGYEDLGTSQDFGPWYDTQTGKQFDRLPMDPRAFQRYARRGWMPGIAPDELRIKWEAGAVDRKAALDVLVAKQTKTEDFKKLKGEVDGSTTSTEDVADAVIDKLVKLGIIKVPVENKIDQETEAANPIGDGNQLKLL